MDEKETALKKFVREAQKVKISILILTFINSLVHGIGHLNCYHKIFQITQKHVESFELFQCDSLREKNIYLRKIDINTLD